jgi:hypothetical protein
MEQRLIGSVSLWLIIPQKAPHKRRQEATEHQSPGEKKLELLTMVRPWLSACQLKVPRRGRGAVGVGLEHLVACIIASLFIIYLCTFFDVVSPHSGRWRQSNIFSSTRVSESMLGPFYPAAVVVRTSLNLASLQLGECYRTSGSKIFARLGSAASR